MFAVTKDYVAIIMTFGIAEFLSFFSICIF